MDFQPTSQQASALEVIGARLEAREPETRLFGYAGTGKTTIAKYIAQHEPGEVLFGAFTGKAASVLTRKGCPATTLHSMIYLPTGDRSAQLEKLEAEYADLEDASSEYGLELGDKIAELQRNINKPGFVLNPASRLAEADLLIVDEVSMVDDRLASDLLGFGVPVIALGDPAQLPPVGKGGYFTGGGEAAADAMLTDIKRFDDLSQVNRLATYIRREQSTRLPRKKGVVVPQIGQSAVLEYDQILVGTNKTRRAKNAKMRRLLGHDTDQILNAGERIIILDNNKDLQVLNGQQFRAIDVRDTDRKGQIEVFAQCECPDVVPLSKEQTDPWAGACPDCGWRPTWIRVWINGFLGEKGETELSRMPFHVKRGAATATFGYAITVHKSQGSEWQNVLVFDESRVFRKDAWRWLYTAVTRAQEKVTVVR